MTAVPMVVELTPENLAEWARQREQLERDFPDWWFHHHNPDCTLHDWEARRRENRLPIDGGVSWIRAGSAERLRELLEGVQRLEAGR
ncbi:hypothetical protein F8568_036765 [Actinomadura sp. LD22]|uniref:Uncharacterized protein n=1 Tax=Actinomadura physcomitrii TaxID=2650748 RepID=A0A6I4MMF2_9ACTN|nr:hypothetical protein [Actinomadura physcomitrii]MWA05815.1 hypothetical protein [Actinomadura physcomitrii]